MKSQKIAILIPAHDEALIIGKTLKALLPELTSRHRIVIIADNCNDQTAAIAKFVGESFKKLDLTVLERNDAEKIGKGYALDCGIKFLENDPPSTVIFIDADCILKSGTISKLAEVASNYERPVQATYLQEQPANPSPKDVISSLAVLVKNFVRLQGLARLGCPCLLYGTGMAFPWSVISKVSLASDNLVEDMQLAIDLAIAGHPPIYCSDAKVTATLPKQRHAAKAQRTRWEHGHLQTLVNQVPRLLKAAITQRRFELFALALDLGVPPLSLLVMLWSITMFSSLLLGVWASVWLPALLLTVTGLLIMISIIISWIRFGRETIPGSVLLTIPLYILWKIPLYFALLLNPQRKWIRTERT